MFLQILNDREKIKKIVCENKEDWIWCSESLVMRKATISQCQEGNALQGIPPNKLYSSSPKSLKGSNFFSSFLK